MIKLFLKTAFLFTFVAAALPIQRSTVAETSEVKRLPNVVVIFIDDLGYADIGPFQTEETKTKYSTPNLDRMAKEGMKFTDFVASSAVCSASRAALLTGCYHKRVSISGALFPRTKHGLNSDEITVAEICKQKDYATACYGKWHLGSYKKFLPLQHGFDDYYGLPYSNDMWPFHPYYSQLPQGVAKRKSNYPKLPIYEKNEVVDDDVTDKDQAELTSEYTRRAVKFIDDNHQRPFFLYVPHSMVHVPLFVSDKFKGKSGAGLFGDVMMEVDWSLGEILNAVRKHKLEKDTLVIFTSDNGPWLSYGDHAGSALPLREGKGTMWEGGYRVPTVMWQPETIPAGTTCDELASTIDVLPTVAAMIDAKLPNHKIDGKDISNLMQGKVDAKSPHESFYLYYAGGELQGVRDRQWKLHFPHKYQTLAGKKSGDGGVAVNYDHKKTGLELYDLKADIAETKNVADEHPEIVERLKKAAEIARKDLGDRLTKTKGTGIRPPGRMPKEEQPDKEPEKAATGK